MCPVVRDETIKLFERVAIGGKPRFFPFEQRVLWLRESDAKIVLRWDGEDLDDQCTLCDFYGYLTAFEEAIKNDGAKIVRAMKLTKEDRLSVDIHLKVIDHAVLPCDDEETRQDALKYAGKKYR